MDLTETVTYPMKSDEWTKTVLIGGVLVFLGFLIVPLFAVYGYLVGTIRRSMAEDPAPPTFSDWSELLRDGVQAWLISLVYLLVPVVVGALTVGGSVMAIATGSDAGAAAGTGGFVVGFVLWAALSLVFGYLAVVGIVNFAREGRFGAGFDLDVIRRVALDREYAVPWLVSVGVVAVASLVSGVPVVGWLLAPFVTFYAAIVAANLWAGGFEQAMESTLDRDRREEGRAAV